MASSTFSTGNAGNFSLASLVQPTIGDGLYAASILYHNIRERTERGVDVNGSQFAPYSEGYRKRKAKELGSADVVDLFGFQNHTHMLNTIVFHTGGLDAQLSNGVHPVEGGDPLYHFEVGIYGDEAKRAEWHNTGAGRNPQRHFFDASQDDLQQMEAGIGQLIQARIQKVL